MAYYKFKCQGPYVDWIVIHASKALVLVLDAVNSFETHNSYSQIAHTNILKVPIDEMRFYRYYYVVLSRSLVT